jgi:hypothetical protein
VGPGGVGVAVASVAQFRVEIREVGEPGLAVGRRDGQTLPAAAWAADERRQQTREAGAAGSTASAGKNTTQIRAAPLSDDEVGVTTTPGATTNASPVVSSRSRPSTRRTWSPSSR